MWNLPDDAMNKKSLVLRSPKLCIELKPLQVESAVQYTELKLLKRGSPVLCIQLKPLLHLISHMDQVSVERSLWRGFQGRLELLSLLCHQLRFYLI